MKSEWVRKMLISAALSTVFNCNRKGKKSASPIGMKQAERLLLLLLLWSILIAHRKKPIFMWLMMSTRGDAGHVSACWPNSIPWPLFSRSRRRWRHERTTEWIRPSRMRQFNCARDARGSWMIKRAEQRRMAEGEAETCCSTGRDA